MPKGIYARKRRPVADRFWAKIEKGAPGECWKWKGSAPFGYGQLYSGVAGEMPLYAHRVSWELHNGKIPDGLWVLHKCDNPPCCNPEHLFLGTQAENMADCSAKNRLHGAPRPGEANPQAKLTADQVAAIRTARGLHREIAERYGISKSYVSNLKRGGKWVHTYNGDAQ